MIVPTYAIINVDLSKEKKIAAPYIPKISHAASDVSHFFKKDLQNVF